MKKEFLLSIISGLFILTTISCKSQKEKIEKSLLKIEFKESFLPITKEDAINFRGGEKFARNLIDINNIRNSNRVFLIRSKFEIDFRSLYSYCSNIPDGGYLYCEYGLKNKIENHLNGFDYSDLNLKISYLDKIFSPINNDKGILFNYFDYNSKKNLNEAFEVLFREQMTHFDSRDNKAAVIFKKSDTLEWLSNPDLDTNKIITFEQVSAWKKTSVMVFGVKNSKADDYIYGNRGQQCCPPQE